jgi:hypothetical protein
MSMRGWTMGLPAALVGHQLAAGPEAGGAVAGGLGPRERDDAVGRAVEGEHRRGVAASMTCEVIVLLLRGRDSRAVTSIPTPTTADPSDRREVARGRARRLLSSIVVVDLVGGLACVALAGPIRDLFDLDSAAPVVVVGLAQLALAVTGWAAFRARPDRLASALRGQAVLDAACAGLLVAVAVTAGASAAGTVVLAAAAAAVAALAAAEVALAARCG